MRINFRWTWVEVLLCVLLVVVAAGEILIYSAPVIRPEQSLGVTVKSVSSAGPSIRLQLAVLHSPADSAIKLAAYPLAKRTDLTQPAVFVYSDGDYPTAGIAPTVAQGVFDHLKGELSAREYRGDVTGVTASELTDVFKDTSKASNRMAVMMTGVMPDKLFSRTIDLVSPWVQAGGTLVWAGGAIGYWDGSRGQALSSTNVVGESGTKRLLGSGVIQYPTSFGRQGTVRSDWASALDLGYKFTGGGLIRDTVTARGGVALGWYSGLYTSVGFLPRGSGGYLIFGGEVPDEASIAVDLTKIVMSHPTLSSGPVAGKLVPLSSASSSATVDWNLPFNAPNGRIMVIAFDPSPDGVYFASQSVAVTGS